MHKGSEEESQLGTWGQSSQEEERAGVEDPGVRMSLAHLSSKNGAVRAGWRSQLSRGRKWSWRVSWVQS